jgi:hypothetical protein
MHSTQEINVRELLVVRVFDEEVGELDLCAVDVLTGDEDGQSSAAVLRFEEGEDVAQLGGETGEKDREGCLWSGRLEW